MKDKKARRERGEYLVEGEKAVSEAVRLGLPITCVLGTPELIAPYIGSGYNVVEADKSIVDHCSDSVTPQGVVASVKIPSLTADKPRGVSVVLDGVKDPGNVGTVIRTCAALGIKSVYLVDCADAYSPKCVRSSMCGIFSVNVYDVPKGTEEGYFSGADVIVADMGGEDVFSARITGDFCLVVGSESHGVSDVFRRLAKRTLSVPMSANMESLNAAIACSVVLYAILKRPIG